MRRYKLRGSINGIILVLMLALIILCLVGFVFAINDLDNILSGHVSIYNLISLLLGLLSCLFIFMVIYQLLDNTFSCELEMDKQLITIRSASSRMFIRWDQIINRGEQRILLNAKYQFIRIEQPIKIFTDGLLGKILFWIKTKIIIYSIFEPEAIVIINGKLKR
jgi:hypothetical protein